MSERIVYLVVRDDSSESMQKIAAAGAEIKKSLGRISLYHGPHVRGAGTAEVLAKELGDFPVKCLESRLLTPHGSVGYDYLDSFVKSERHVSEEGSLPSIIVCDSYALRRYFEIHKDSMYAYRYKSLLAKTKGDLGPGTWLPL